MRSLGYIHTPEAAHHRWVPYSRRSIATGRGELDHGARLLLHRMRWRKPPRRLGLTLVAALLSLLVHVAGLFSMLLIRPPPMPAPAAVGHDNAIQVRFIETRPAPPPPPVPPVPAQPLVARTPRRVPPPARAPKPVPAKPRVAARIERPRPRPVPAPTPKPTPKPASKPLPPVASPPPERVFELSPMSVPVPRITLPAVAASSVQVAVKAIAPTPPKQTEVAAAPGSAPLPAVSTRPAVDLGKVAPSPPASIAATPARAASIGPVQPAPAATSRVLPAAPLSAPQVRLARVQAAPVRVPASRPSPTAQPAPIASVPVPSRASSVVAPARPRSVPPPSSTPAPTNWAQQSDTFSKLPARQPGQGVAGQGQAGAGSTKGVPAYIQRQPQGNSDVMTRHYRGFHYKRTIFDQYWAPDNQGLLTSLLQRMVNALSFHKTIDLGHGARIHCGGWLLGFGCGGSPPEKMSRLSNDRRLDMAPAKPLVPGLGASVAAPASAPAPESSMDSVTCETARVAGGPLPPGCPARKGGRARPR